MDRRPKNTSDVTYAEWLKYHDSIWWKRLVDVQRPYRRHLRSLDLGFVLDVGCGLGRNLNNLAGNGIGLDHNPELVASARARGFTVFLPDEFLRSEYGTPGRFDALLVSHVVEHMHFDEARILVETYLPFLRQGGRVVFITPQLVGFRSDPTHVEFFDFPALTRLAEALGLHVQKHYSFPFPEFAGRLFRHNEFVLLAEKVSVNTPSDR
jgi:SAM-dependent methyltransferase